MDKISINGDIRGKNIAIGSGSTINENIQRKSRNVNDNSRGEILRQLDEIDRMIVDSGDQLDDVIALRQDISIMKEEFNKKNIDRTAIDSKMNKLESAVKSLANIASAVNTIKTFITNII